MKTVICVNYQTEFVSINVRVMRVWNGAGTCRSVSAQVLNCFPQSRVFLRPLSENQEYFGMIDRLEMAALLAKVNMARENHSYISRLKCQFHWLFLDNHLWKTHYPLCTFYFNTLICFWLGRVCFCLIYFPKDLFC